MLVTALNPPNCMVWGNLDSSCFTSSPHANQYISCPTEESQTIAINHRSNYDTCVDEYNHLPNPQIMVEPRNLHWSQRILNRNWLTRIQEMLTARIKLSKYDGTNSSVTSFSFCWYSAASKLGNVTPLDGIYSYHVFVYDSVALT